MAFTRNPTLDTYSTQRINAAHGVDLRPNSSYLNGGSTIQDAGMVNLIPFKASPKDSEVSAVTRNPIHARAVIASQISRGCYVWEKSVGTTYYFLVAGTGVYTSTDAVTWSLVNTLTTVATTPVRFCEFINDTNTKSLVLVDGVEGYVFTSNAAGTKITSANFPSPHVPFPVFIDGYLVLAKAGTGDVYNSDLNHPELWTAGNFLSSELYPDDIQALVKINNYILVIGTQGCEYFYDAGNAPGTPFARYDGGSLPFGTQFPNSVASNKNVCWMIANNNDGENVIKVIQDFKDSDLPSFVVPALNTRLQAASATAAGVRGFLLRQRGELMYGVSFQGDAATPPVQNGTWVYSISEGMWTEFRIGSTGADPFPVYFTATTNTGRISTYVAGHYGGAAFFGAMEEGAASPFTNVASDNIVSGVGAVPIYTEIRTGNQDFGTRNRKWMYSFMVGATESTSSSATSGSSLSVNVSWTDDDFATYSTPVAVFVGAAANSPYITQLGQFRQRSFKITYNGSSFLRYKFFECDINKGQQ